MAEGSNFIFYCGKDCDLSRHVMLVMHKSGFLQHFIAVDVLEKTEMIQFLEKSGITMVPAVIVKDFPKPIYGNDIIRWMQNMKAMREANQKKLVAANILNTLQQALNSKDTIAGYNPLEMGKMSDSFSFHDENISNKLNATSKFGEAFSQSFFEYGGEKNNWIFTADANIDKQNKMNKAVQDKKMRELQKQRKDEEEKMQERMKELQLDAILRAEREQNL